ncbi:ABC-type transporter, integral membrane subunit [Methanobacterium lacus]|uniref:ABC-type transporter, integral membrane subunit n=1 Tax=Methanobacterium lacus (strain AL-21) TaxID=877455 RepID=F0T9D6_METLA|nr:ABC transporter permease [Methanobacterium lacus]ADZ09887.1 ABC-type transporter, integral membrane subunit [Methanobacterium lacus]
MRKTIISLVIPAIIIVIWAVLTTYTGIIPSYLIPSPHDVFEAFKSLLMNGTLIQDTIDTLSRVILGFIVAAIVAVPLGILIGWSETVENYLSFIIGILRPIPPIAWIPFAILWFGLGLGSAIFIIFVGSVFPILISTADGVKRIDKVYIESAYTLGADKLQTIKKVVFPAALPNIITGLKVGMGIALMCTVAAEMIGSNNGLGYLILTATSMLDSASAIVGMLAIGVIGLTFEYIFTRMERKLNW